MKDAKMNVETLSRAELLTLLSILEGELEAQDVVIHALRAQHRDSFVQQRYGQYDLSDPFLALQRDSEPQERPLLLHPDGHLGRRRHPVGPNPLAVLKLVMAHCQRTQETMVGQLAAAEARHKKMMGELQEEQRHSVQTSTHNQQLVCRLQSHNQQLVQQLDVERAAVQRLEQEQAAAAQQVEESLSQQQQQLAALRLQLQEGALKVSELRGLLEEERSRAGQAEAQQEAELQQAKARLGREEARSRELERQLEELKKEVTEGKRVAGPGSKVNGHKVLRETEEGREDGGGAPLLQPLQHPQSPSSLSSSPASSPILTKRPPGPALLPSSYQAGVNQRFQAARHKFQSQAELEQQQQLGGGALSPRDLSPVASPPPAPPLADHSAARQLARHTVTQVLSRFTSQQAPLKLPAASSNSSSSPFGTDYRNLATGGRSPSSTLPPPLASSRSSPLSPASRADKTPPPAPPKKPGMMSPTPGSPSHCSRSSNSHFPELTGNCGHAGCNSGADGAAAVTSQS